MSFTPDSNQGVTTGTTAVTIVAAPGSGVKRIVKTITVVNRDTAARTVTCRLLVSATNYWVFTQVMQPSESLIFGGEGEIVVLDSTKALNIILDSAPATNQLDWTSHWSDYAA